MKSSLIKEGGHYIGRDGKDARRVTAIYPEHNIIYWFGWHKGATGERCQSFQAFSKWVKSKVSIVNGVRIQ